MNSLRKLFTALFLMSSSASFAADTLSVITSPTTKLRAEFILSSRTPYIVVKNAAGKQMAKVKLGVQTQEVNYEAPMTFVSASEPVAVYENYQPIHGKRSSVSNTANSVTVTLANKTEQQMQVEVRAYEDGVVFRYIIDGAEDRKLHFTSELTSYQIPTKAHRWLQSFNTSYEADFPYQPSSGKTGTWGYPALFEFDGSFALITEANIGRNYSCTHLDNSASAAQYQVAYPFDYEGYGVGDAKPTATGPWTSPWRVMIVGNLGTVVESTLVEDVSTPCVLQNTSFVKPGRAAWIYWAYNHSSNDYQICKKYADLAENMGWEYELIDWEWEQMGNGGSVEDALNYAINKGVKPMLWYHSNNEKIQKQDLRRQEFAWLKSVGVKGVKIDFFESDKQHTMQYFADILEDAAKYQIMVNFHGCTVPRGWSRTYPNLMSQEAVFGGEQYNNGGFMTTDGARINCLLTYTRNVIGPMDYTPVAFTDSQHPHTTTFAHELALSVAFESGLQHWADRPEGFYALPLMAKQHMMEVPVTWDETRFIDGYPEKSFIIARRKGDTWYVAALNGTTQPATYDIPLSFLDEGAYTVSCIADGKAARSFSFSTHTLSRDSHFQADCLARGGCLLTLRKSATVTNAKMKSLQKKVDDLLTQAEGRIGDNSGYYSQTAVAELTAASQLCKSVASDASSTAAQRYAAYQQLLAAYSNFEENGTVEAGLINVDANLQDITNQYLIESRCFSRTDESTGPSTSRFGLLAEPWIVTDNIINQDNGSHGGFDSFEGGKAISIEKWDGGEPAMVNDKIYQTTSKAVPAGDYHLHISVSARYGLGGESCLLRVAKGDQLPDRGVSKDVLATYDMSRTDYSGEYDVCSFHLDQAETLTLGWVLNIPQNEGNHAFRVTAIRLIDGNGRDVSSTYLANYENVERKDCTYKRFGQPTNWQVEDFYIPNGNDGIKQGIDRYPGYDCLMLGTWDDSRNATGNLSDARIYCQVTLPAGRYVFCSAYNAIYNLKSAYVFAATEPLTTAQTPANALAYYHMNGTPEGNDLYGITFILREETTLYLGWNADLTTAAQQEFRAKTVRLFRDTDYASGVERPTPAPLEVMHNSQFIIHNGAGAMFDLSGRHISVPSVSSVSSVLPKGVYILNNRKVAFR